MIYVYIILRVSGKNMAVCDFIAIAIIKLSQMCNKHHRIGNKRVLFNVNVSTEQQVIKQLRLETS